jgi:hypothetical protein
VRRNGGHEPFSSSAPGMFRARLLLACRQTWPR